MRKIGAMAMVAVAAVGAFACGSFKEDIAPLTPTEQPQTSTPVKSDAGPVDDPAHSDPTPAPVTAAPTTCGALRTLSPRATFNAQEVAMMGQPIAPIDMYAVETVDTINDGENPVHSVRSLRLVLTEQPDECAIRGSNLEAEALNEVSFEIRQTSDSPEIPAPLGPGVYFTDPKQNANISILYFHDWGTRCSGYNADDAGGSSVVGVGDPIQGTISIESRTATEIAGTIALTSSQGSTTHVTFKAPICGVSGPKASPLCCAPT